MPPPALTRYRRELDEYLESLLDRVHPLTLDRMIRYHLGWQNADGAPSDNRGKALRPSLCMLACEAAGGDPIAALPSAAAVEFVHNFSLLHDEIQDHDRVRHHRPTVWTIWGEAQAINAGDALLALARLAVLRVEPGDGNDASALDSAQALDELTLEMVEGQVMDLEFEDTFDVDVTAYLTMVEKKTGALFDCSMRLGALAAGAGQDVADRLGRSGRLMGLAFQIRDDMLGIWGVETRTGKEVAADIRRRKKTLPIVYALSLSDEVVGRRVRDGYSAEVVSEQGVSDILSSLDGISAQQYCAELASEKRDESLVELKNSGLSGNAADELSDVVNFLLERDY
ncbi:MAG: polyprenyl synthetase family protein [Chloroflexi bacterium]|nr:polyprenyl synthetase family protein [Chloroflexota bacterium]